MTDNEILIQLLSEIKEMKADLQEVKTGQAKLEAGQAVLKADLLATKSYIETEIPRQIKVIAEQHVEIIAKFDALADYPETKSRVATLERVAEDHTRKMAVLEEKAV